jgi:hypothetical protein
MNSIAIPVGGDETPLPAEPEPALALPAPLAPDHVPQDLQIQATYRLLVGSGMPGADAAALIGYAVGLPPCQSRWSLAQINSLLFLRNLYAGTEWGESERQPA